MERGYSPLEGGFLERCLFDGDLARGHLLTRITPTEMCKSEGEGKTRTMIPMILFSAQGSLISAWERERERE